MVLPSGKGETKSVIIFALIWLNRAWMEVMQTVNGKVERLRQIYLMRDIVKSVELNA